MNEFRESITKVLKTPKEGEPRIDEMTGGSDEEYLFLASSRKIYQINEYYYETI